VANNINRFHRVSGFRREASEVRATSVRRRLQAAGSLNTYFPTRSRLDDLSAVFRAMEQRLAALIEDRGRLTRDLHDSVLQSLYAIGLGLETVRRSNVQGPAWTGHSGNLLVDQLNRLIQEIRLMIRSLESGQVQEFDLGSELQSLVDTYKPISPLRITIDIAPHVVALATNEEKREVLMIVREAVSNCVRHARATHAAVSLYARGTRLRLLIADDGVGFAQEENQREGYGLASMAARAKKLGGRLLVRSHTGKGTRILVEFLLEPNLWSV
jgi:two-component system, NarL family, sensor kinase